MDLLPPYFSFPQVQHGPYYFSWKCVMVILWLTFQNHFLSGGDTASVALHETLSSLAGRPVIMSALVNQIISKDINGSTDIKLICEGCKAGENGKFCSGEAQGECDCSSEIAICRCKDGWAGDSCQFKISKVNCEKMRSCILCRVYKMGPLAEEKDCHFYCDRSYPTPLILKDLHFQDDEHLCSFIHHSHADSKADCRYFFKYGKIDADGNLDSSNYYIVAQQDMICGKLARFPTLRSNDNSAHNKSFQTFAKNYETAVRSSEFEEEDVKRNSFISIVVILVFVALPFVACIFALIYNFSHLPCGLCNIFRQSSSKYLRNVRPFPGYAPSEQTTQL